MSAAGFLSRVGADGGWAGRVGGAAEAALLAAMQRTVRLSTFRRAIICGFQAATRAHVSR
ncbi:hypothetical protein BVI2075_230167 [Burkholderia vietnamiensis]|nr:hypothetical protein BVI2075_230167 [Burkholderia vietnamiensis]